MKGRHRHSLSKQRFKSDNLGNRSEVDDVDSAGKLYQRILYKHDERGRVIEESTGDAESARFRCTFTYDTAGLVKEEVCKRSMGTSQMTDISTFKYETDSRGNWIKRTGEQLGSLFNGETRKGELPAAYRVIEYYGAEQSGTRDREPGINAGTGLGVELKPCEAVTVRKSGGELQGSARKRKMSAYPAAARDNGIGGMVQVEVTIDELRKVVSVRSISGAAELRPAAEEAARGWEFTPTTLSKMPVRVIGVITFNFTL